MSEHQPDPPDGRTKYEYFVDQTRYEFDAPAISGAQIKARIPGFNPTFQVFVEGRGQDADRQIADADSVALDRGAPHLYTAPPATFGG
jgi:hypothetical protein